MWIILIVLNCIISMANVRNKLVIGQIDENCY